MGKIKDLAGMKFGELTAIEYGGKNKSGGSLWVCICSCGKKTSVSLSNLRSGSTKSCGHLAKYEDLSGMKFGEWTVVKHHKMNAKWKHLWECMCSCGVIKMVLGDALKYGESKSCGHVRKYKNDISGEVFGHLTVIFRDGCDAYNNIMWKCQCDCGSVTRVQYHSLVKDNGTRACRNKIHRIKDITGKTYRNLTVVSFSGIHDKESWWNCECVCGGKIEASAGDLNRGNVNSCGCLKYKNKRNLTGQRFAYLTAVEENGRKNRMVVWKCLCDCGNEIDVVSHNLVSGHTKSCGCMSSYLKAVGQTTHGLCYTKEYKCMKSRERKELKLMLDTEWTPRMEKELASYFPDCIVCGKTKRMSTDHVLPLSKMNPLRPGNAVRLCGSCNSIKGPRNLDEIPKYMRDIIVPAAENFRIYWESLLLEHQVQ